MPIQYRRTLRRGKAAWMASRVWWLISSAQMCGMGCSQAGGSLRAFSDVCTHLGCRVSWRLALQHYVSPCHDGHFDVLGRNISGPPPRPPDEYTTRIEAGKVFIQLPAFKRSG